MSHPARQSGPSRAVVAGLLETTARAFESGELGHTRGAWRRLGTGRPTTCLHAGVDLVGREIDVDPDVIRVARQELYRLGYTERCNDSKFTHGSRHAVLACRMAVASIVDGAASRRALPAGAGRTGRIASPTPVPVARSASGVRS